MTTLHRLLALTITMMLCTSLHSLSVRVNCCGGRGRMMITFTTPPFSSLLVLGSLHHRWMASSTSGGDAYTCSGGDSMKLFSSSSSNKYSSHGSNSNSNRNNKKDIQHSYRSTNTNAKSGRSSDSEIEVRLNKCIPSLSRRAADDAIAAGLVTVNNVVATNGCKVKLGDKVRYKNVLQSWEEKAICAEQDWSPSEVLEDRDFIYLKYWKPVGVTCTADLRDPTNILSAGKFNLLPQRVFTVGRLDKDSSGLILLTSDGRVNDAMLNKKDKKEKVYQVEMNKTPSDEQLEEMSRGVEITTPIQRDNSEEKLITAKTLPCYVKRIKSNSNTQQDSSSSSTSTSYSRKVEFTLIEGRNRQIRRMAEAVGLEVVALHRISFAGIRLKGLSQGNWCELSGSEMKIVQEALLQNKSKSGQREAQ